MYGCEIWTIKKAECRTTDDKINIEAEDVAGRSGSLMKSLIASAMGWSRPYGPTTFGPFRNCM